MGEELVVEEENVEEELVRSVGFKVEGADGKCTRCKEEGPVIQLTALVYYPGRNAVGQTCVVESRWIVQYCSFCFKRLVHPDAEDDAKVDVSYQ